MRKSASGLAWSLAKTAITISLAVLILSKIDFSALAQHLHGGGGVFLFLATLALATNAAIVGLRWWLLLRRLGVATISAGYAIAGTYVSVFAGQIMPGIVGADAVRGYLCHRQGVKIRPIVLSLVTDRLLALFVLCAVVAAVCYWQFGVAAQSAALRIAALAAIVIAGIAGALWLLPPLAKVLAKRWPRLHAVHEFVEMFRVTALSGAGAAGLVLSGAVIVLTVSAVLLFARGLGIALPVPVAYLVVPVAYLFASLPISLGGWGVREASLSYGLTVFGVPTDDAALVGVAVGVGVLLSSLPGGVVMLALGEQVLPRRFRTAGGPAK